MEYEAAEFVKKYPDSTKKQDAFRKNFRKADTVLIEHLNKGHNGETLVTRSKMSKVRERAAQWKMHSDEVLELKKIFYEFLKNTVASKEKGSKAQLTLYERYDTDEYFTLDSLIGLGAQSQSDVVTEASRKPSKNPKAQVSGQFLAYKK